LIEEIRRNDSFVRDDSREKYEQMIRSLGDDSRNRRPFVSENQRIQEEKEIKKDPFERTIWEFERTIWERKRDKKIRLRERIKSKIRRNERRNDSFVMNDSRRYKKKKNDSFVKNDRR